MQKRRGCGRTRAPRSLALMDFHASARERDARVFLCCIHHKTAEVVFCVSLYSGVLEELTRARAQVLFGAVRKDGCICHTRLDLGKRRRGFYELIM